MERLEAGVGGSTSCGSRCCPFDARFCVSKFGGQCAIHESKVDEKCGAWAGCGGVVCSYQYGQWCLARRVIDRATFHTGRWVYTKPATRNATESDQPFAHPQFVRRLREDQQLAQYKVIDAHPGTFDGCSQHGGPIFWISMGGHLRSADMHLPNSMSFVRASSSCWFVALFLRRVVHMLGKHGGSSERKQCEDTVARKAAAVAHAFGSNVAWAVSHRKGSWMWANMDTWWGGWALLAAAARVHRIRESENDVVLFTRPDLTFSRAVDVSRLSMQSRYGHYVLYAPHHSASPGTGNDPSELWAMTTSGYWRQQLRFCSPRYVSRTCQLGSKHCDHKGVRHSWAACPGAVGRICGITNVSKVDSLGQVPLHLNAETYYMNGDLGVHLHRVTGGWNVAINSGRAERGSAAPAAALTESDRVDLTQRVRCILPLRPTSTCEQSGSAAPHAQAATWGSAASQGWPVQRGSTAWYPHSVCSELIDLRASVANQQERRERWSATLVSLAASRLDGSPNGLSISKSISLTPWRTRRGYLRWQDIRGSHASRPAAALTDHTRSPSTVSHRKPE